MTFRAEIYELEDTAREVLCERRCDWRAQEKRLAEIKPHCEGVPEADLLCRVLLLVCGAHLTNNRTAATGYAAIAGAVLPLYLQLLDSRA